jgi:hypothetical protein
MLLYIYQKHKPKMYTFMEEIIVNMPLNQATTILVFNYKWQALYTMQWAYIIIYTNPIVCHRKDV